MASGSTNPTSNDNVPLAVSRGRRSGTGKVGFGRRYADEVGMDQIEWVDDRSNGSNNKKYVGEKAMLAEAQKKYPTAAIGTGEMKRSERIQAKKKRNYAYNDGKARINAVNYDNCDCLVPECPGCHMPCKRCGDRRCGLDCRRGRRYIYSSVEIDGSTTEYFNPNHEDYQNQNPDEDNEPEKPA